MSPSTALAKSRTSTPDRLTLTGPGFGVETGALGLAGKTSVPGTMVVDTWESAPVGEDAGWAAAAAAQARAAQRTSLKTVDGFKESPGVWPASDPSWEGTEP